MDSEGIHRLRPWAPTTAVEPFNLRVIITSKPTQRLVWLGFVIDMAVGDRSSRG